MLQKTGPIPHTFFYLALKQRVQGQSDCCIKETFCGASARPSAHWLFLWLVLWTYSQNEGCSQHYVAMNQ